MSRQEFGPKYIQVLGVRECYVEYTSREVRQKNLSRRFSIYFLILVSSTWWRLPAVPTAASVAGSATGPLSTSHPPSVPSWTRRSPGNTRQLRSTSPPGQSPYGKRSVLGCFSREVQATTKEYLSSESSSFCSHSFQHSGSTRSPPSYFKTLTLASWRQWTILFQWKCENYIVHYLATR